MKKIISLSVLVSVWFVGLLFIVNWTIQNKPFTPTFPYSKEVLTPYGSRILTTWANFDGIHYVTIVNKGYHGTGLIQAFFPVYPGLIKLFALNGLHNPLIIGVSISLVCLLVSLLVLYKLIELDDSEVVAKKSIWLLLLFPTSFFFAAIYTESIFLMLVVTCFYFARTKRWWLAGIVAAIASGTRLVGIFLWPVLIWEFFHVVPSLSPQILLNKYKKTLPALLLPPLGLASFMLYLQARFHDPFLFIHVQNQFGASRETDKLILLYQVYYRYVRMLATVDRQSLLYFTIVMEFLAGIIGTIGSLFAYLKLRPSYFLFVLLSFITPTLTGTFSSLGRYLLVIFPLFILAAKYLPQKLYLLWIVISSALLIYNLTLFTRGLWVA